ncbi:hypothetical protein JCM5353_006791 [Sporobolomyces roseus]
MIGVALLAVVGTSLFASSSAQTYRRSAACPGLGCVYPPSQVDFVAGQVFDIRIEVQAPVNGSRPYNNGTPSPDFSIVIGRKEDGSDAKSVSEYFKLDEPAVDSYNFTYYEDLFYQDNKTATLVNVLAQDWRHVALYEPGDYFVKLTYNNGMENVAKWNVLEIPKKRKAKNVILMIGDGMAPTMVTAARMIGHKTINGKYQTRMALDTPDALGIQMSKALSLVPIEAHGLIMSTFIAHSLDSYITDSANSATALMAGHKSTVNALNVYTDSTGSGFNNPRFETVFEQARRIYGAQIGIVSTAYSSDATLAAVCTHTSQRSQSDFIISQFLDGISANHSWTHWDGPDVLFAGGGSDWLPRESNGNVSQIGKWQDRGYNFVHSNTTLNEIGNDERALGLFSTSTMPTWLDRNIFKDNLQKPSFAAYNTENKTFTAPNTDSPGLKEMAIKAIDILHQRSEDKDVPFMAMIEAASIDKAMHVADMERAMGELLEFDNTIKTVLAHLKKLGIDEDTLVVATADHGHGFDVFGSADTAYMSMQESNAGKRRAIGTYAESGLSGYQVQRDQNPQNTSIQATEDGFPATWDPRYTAAWGLAATVDKYNDFRVHNSTRETSIENEDGTYSANEADSPTGFLTTGNLPVTNDQGVHSLTDVGVYAYGAGSECFRGVFNSPEIAHKIAEVLALGQSKNVTYSSKKTHSSFSSSREKVKL